MATVDTTPTDLKARLELKDLNVLQSMNERP